MKNVTLLSAALITVLLSGCASFTKRNEPSDAEINAQAEKAYAEVKANSKPSGNVQWNQMVQRVSQRIAAASHENFKWESILIENPEPNAWCMPGGKMAVNTGIMPILKTEGALAAVLGHEVAHATLRHGKQRYARAITEQTLATIIGGAAILTGQVICKSSTCRTITALGGAAAGFGIAFFNRKYSRQDELEADQAGQVFMARAGYDPAESIELWNRMSAAGGGGPPEWISTHPSDERRSSELHRLLPESSAIYAKSPQKYGIGEPIR